MGKLPIEQNFDFERCCLILETGDISPVGEVDMKNERFDLLRG